MCHGLLGAGLSLEAYLLLVILQEEYTKPLIKFEQSFYLKARDI